ncbi:MAG: hypothetical protein AAFX06_15345 [Planctomycetota bacterium]
MKNALTHTAFAVAMVCAGFANSAAAQSCTSGYHNNHAQNHGFRFHAPLHVGYRYGGFGYGVRYPYDHRFGTAELIRASAESSVLRAQARTQNLEADRLQMQNSIDFLHTRLERKRINRESRFGHLHRRGEMVRAEKLAKAAAEPAPKPIVAAETGRVNWPLLLRTSHYAKARQPVDSVFHERSLNGSINPDHYLPMRDWLHQIEDELKANVANYDMQDYLEAKRFLRDLIDEARQDLPVTMDFQLAAN